MLNFSIAHKKMGRPVISIQNISPTLLAVASDWLFRHSLPSPAMDVLRPTALVSMRSAMPLHGNALLKRCIHIRRQRLLYKSVMPGDVARPDRGIGGWIDPSVKGRGLCSQHR